MSRARGATHTQQPVHTGSVVSPGSSDSIWRISTPQLAREPPSADKLPFLYCLRILTFFSYSQITLFLCLWLLFFALFRTRWFNQEAKFTFERKLINNYKDVWDWGCDDFQKTYTFLSEANFSSAFWLKSSQPFEAQRGSRARYIVIAGNRGSLDDYKASSKVREWWKIKMNFIVNWVWFMHRK